MWHRLERIVEDSASKLTNGYFNSKKKLSSGVFFFKTPFFCLFSKHHPWHRTHILLAKLPFFVLEIRSHIVKKNNYFNCCRICVTNSTVTDAKRAILASSKSVSFNNVWTKEMFFSFSFNNIPLFSPLFSPTRSARAKTNSSIPMVFLLLYLAQ